MSSPQNAVRQRVPRIAEAAVERARLTVVPRARTRAAKVPFVSLVTLLLVGGVVGLLLFNTSMQQSSFTATDLQQQATVLSAREEALSMQLQQLRDPQAIAERAQKLGMQVPAAPLFLDLADGSVDGDPTGAKVTAPVVLSPPPAARPSQLDPPTTVVVPPEGVLPGQSSGQSTGQSSGASHGGSGKSKHDDSSTTSHTKHNKNNKHSQHRSNKNHRD